MKTIIIDDEKIEISDESYEAFKKQFVTKDKAILWRPEDGERFYCVSTYGAAEYYVWENSGWQIQDWELGNIFKTKEEAEEALKTGWIAKRKAEVEILRFIAENDLEWEWSSRSSNYSLSYNHEAGIFIAESWGTQQHSNLFYFNSIFDARKVIDAMTPELKILFGVK